jgi:hypothetical protein
MQRILLLVTLGAALLTNVSLAQKYKIKDGIITYDKAPVGKVVGDVGVDKTDLQVLGNDGKKVMIVRGGRFDVKNPFFSWISWYQIKFTDTGKELFIPHAGNCGTKCFLNNAMAPAGIVLDGGPIKEQDAIIAKSDISAKLAKDTTEIRSTHNQWISLLTKNSIIRDKEKQVVVSKQEESTFAETTTTTYLIAQDNIVLGKIIKKHTASSTGIRTEYDIFETLYQPEGTLKEVPAGRVTDTFMSLDFVTVLDGRKHSIKMDDMANAQNALANYFVAKGYL